MTASDPLVLLGDRLEAAARRDLARELPTPAAAGVARRPRRRRRLAVALVAAVIGVPGAAVAARHLLASPDEVAASMPAGTLALAGTEPTCTVVRPGVEFHCRLARAPSHEVEDWRGTVEPSVDVGGHVNGGCRSLASDGRVWQCYIGQAAVDQEIIGPGLLGEASQGPGVG